MIPKIQSRETRYEGVLDVKLPVSLTVQQPFPIISAQLVQNLHLFSPDFLLISTDVSLSFPRKVDVFFPESGVWKYNNTTNVVSKARHAVTN